MQNIVIEQVTRAILDEKGDLSPNRLTRYVYERITGKSFPRRKRNAVLMAELEGYRLKQWSILVGHIHGQWKRRSLLSQSAYSSVAGETAGEKT